MAGRDVIDRYHRAIAIGDYEVVTALHAPEVVVWMSGRSIVSGRFQGRERLFAHMTHHVLGPLDVEAEEYVKGVRILVDDGDYVAVIFHGGLPNRTGGRYDQYYLQIFRLGDGLIQEIVELFDTAMYEEAVAGHRLEQPRERPASPFIIAAPLPGAADRETVLALAEAFAAAARRADWHAIGGLLAADCTLEVAGTTPYSGVGRFDPDRLRDCLEGGIGWSHIACADRKGAVLLMTGADPAYPQNFGIVIEANGNVIARISLFWDTAAAEMHLFGNRFCPDETRSIMPPFDPRLAFRG